MSLRAVALLALLASACTARHLVVPDHASAGGAADYGLATLQVRSFLVTGLGSSDDASLGPAALRSAFAEYVTSQCRFRDVRFGKEEPAGPALAVDVSVTADHTASRTWILDYVGLSLWWPVVPQWGTASVKVSLAAADGSARWSAEGTGDADYSMTFYAWWRTAPVEEAYKTAYAAAFRKAATSFCSDLHTARYASGAPAPQRPEPVKAAPVSTAAPVSSVAPGGGKVAVLDFRNFTRDLQKENVQYFTDLVRGVVLRASPRFNVMTRENLLVLLQASGKDLAACEGECEVDTGRRIGADLIVSGDIQKVGTRFKISLRMHETRDGRLVSTAIGSGGSVDALDDAATKAADDLVAPLR
jgi:TolB-like protein